MSSPAGEVLERFYAAVVQRDLAAARQHLSDALVFEGLFETYRGPEEYFASLRQLLQVTRRLEVRKIVAEGNDAVVLFELETGAPVEATTLVAEWHQVEGGRIARVRSVFDGRPFAAMFARPPDRAEDERAIRALKEVFARALLAKDARLRASTFAEDGTVAPPQGGLFQGRAAMEKHFETEAASITDKSRATFTHYRFRFPAPDVAFVDTEILLNDVRGPDGRVRDALAIAVAFTAVRHGGGWLVQDERATLKGAP